MLDQKLPTTRVRSRSREQNSDEIGKAEVTRQGILDAAARIFRRDGYSGTRLTDIAAGVGMKAGSLYYHFDSREALVEAVMAIGTEQNHKAILERLNAMGKDATPIERLKAALETHLLMVLAHEDITSATIKLIWQVPPQIREKLLVEQRSYGQLWGSLLNDARRVNSIRSDLDLSVVRMAILGALNWAADWYKPGRMTPKQIAHDIAHMVLGGLAAPGHTQKNALRKRKRNHPQNRRPY